MIYPTSHLTNEKNSSSLGKRNRLAHLAGGGDRLKARNLPNLSQSLFFILYTIRDAPTLGITLSAALALASVTALPVKWPSHTSFQDPGHQGKSQLCLQQPPDLLQNQKVWENLSLEGMSWFVQSIISLNGYPAHFPSTDDPVKKD